MKPGTWGHPYSEIPNKPFLPASVTPPPPAPLDLNAAFEQATARQRAAREKFIPLLTALNAEIAKVQDIGLTGVGFRLATTESLKEVNVFDDRSPRQQGAIIGILDIYDSKFMVRIDHYVNLHHVPQNPQSVDSLPSRIGIYDVKDAADRNLLATFIIETAAANIENEALRKFDAPAEKPSQKQSIKRRIAPE